MSAVSEALLRRLGESSHFELLGALQQLEAAEREAAPEDLPRDAERLRAALWPFLQAYGLRDHHGSVVDRMPAPLPYPLGGGG